MKPVLPAANKPKRVLSRTGAGKQGYTPKCPLPASVYDLHGGFTITSELPTISTE